MIADKVCCVLRVFSSTIRQISNTRFSVQGSGGGGGGGGEEGQASAGGSDSGSILGLIGPLLGSSSGGSGGVSYYLPSYITLVLNNHYVLLVVSLKSGFYDYCNWFK